MSFYTIFKIILGIIMTIAILYWGKLYGNLGKVSTVYDKDIKKVLKKKTLQKAKMVFLVILFFVLLTTTIIDFLAK